MRHYTSGFNGLNNDSCNKRTGRTHQSMNGLRPRHIGNSTLGIEVVSRLQAICSIYCVDFHKAVQAKHVFDVAICLGKFNFSRPITREYYSRHGSSLRHFMYEIICWHPTYDDNEKSKGGNA